MDGEHAGDGLRKGTGPVRAFGGAVWRDGPSGPEVLLVHRPSYDDWSLPKGKLDPGEEPLTCALREVTEETAVECHAGPELGTVRYSETNRRTGTSVMKEVTFFEMHPVSAGHHAPDDEVDDIAWLLLDQARDRCTYPTDRQIIDLLASRITSRT